MNRRSSIPHLLGGALFLLIGVILWPALDRGIERIRYTVPSRSPDDGLEGTLVHEAQLIRQGLALYRPIVAEEFVSAPYTPLYTVVLAAPSFDQTRPFTAGRSISLAALIGVALLVALFVGRHSGWWWLGGSAALMILAFPPAQLWATRVKPDVLALFWTTLGLSLASFRRGRWADWAAVAFALAFFTKQTALIAPFAVGVNLIITDWRRAARYALTYGLALGLPYLTLDLVTGGMATAHIWGLHRSEWWRFALFWKYVELLRWSLPLLGLALLGLGAVRQHHAYRQALIYALLAPLTLYGAGEIGAHHNHLLETMLAWTLAGGVGAGLAFTAGLRPGQRPLQRGLVGLAAGLVLWQGWLLRPTPAWYGGEFAPPSLERFVAYLESKPGEALADNPALLLLADKPIRFDDPSTMGPAIRSGVWDPAVLHEMIRQRQFGVILLEVDLRSETSDATGRWTDETLAVIGEHYQLEFEDRLFSYVPRP
ncbi:MAG: hypothetical protein H0T53_11795 [Herpetosiphonaceae bacterium]|nr:hypothetical protein [Herpetosiphonaceae bacterium]